MPENTVPPDRLYRRCDPSALGFQTTAELEPLDVALGQDDAMAALEFGLAIEARGYNIFVAGSPGSGRQSFVRQVLGTRAAKEPAPPDWCYVFNFADARRPRALRLPTGKAGQFRSDMEALVTDLREAIPRALESDDVVARRTALVEEHQKPAVEALETLRREVEADENVALAGDATAPTVVAARGGKALAQEEYLQLPEEVRAQVDERLREAKTRVMSVQRELNDHQREARGRVEELNREVAGAVVAHHIGALKDRYADLEPVTRHLDELAEDVVRHTGQFSTAAEETPEPMRMLLASGQQDIFKRYQVNVLVTRRPDEGAPFIEEPNPHLNNLLGRMDRQVQFGTMVSDFTGIAPGAMHRANGGYLLLDAVELLTRPLAWPALKRTLRTGELRFTDMTAESGLVVAADSMDPEPIPADLKIIIVGDAHLFYLLQVLDKEFGEIFKVKSDFRPHMERTPETETSYARFVAARCDGEELPAFDAPAVAAIVEEGSRQAGDQAMLSTRFGEVTDLIRESAYFATAEQQEPVTATHVRRALDERERRDNRLHRELLDLIERGVLTFEPTGEEAGQLYGIGLTSVGGLIFGRPLRVMASAYMGTAGVIQIEREARLSGPIHSKGFLVLSGYLGWLFARAHPLILSASLSFEQLYEEVEGDSASVAELYCLLSAIGSLRLRQGIAVTGAISQTGAVLPVGGVTEKVEGFFAACERTGLTGEQGVILPRRNVDHLVLRPRVREAVENGRFHLHAIDRIEEGWPILSGREAGQPDEAGHFPEGTVHRDVADRLARWVREWQRMGAAVRGEGGDDVPPVAEQPKAA